MTCKHCHANQALVWGRWCRDCWHGNSLATLLSGAASHAFRAPPNSQRLEERLKRLEQQAFEAEVNRRRSQMGLPPL